MSSKTKTIATKDETKHALVPKLRFPEFRGAEAWHPYLLEELEDLGWVELGRGEVISGQDIKAIPGDYPIYSSSVKNNGLMGTYGRFMFDEELISWSVDGGGDFFHRPRHKFSVTNISGYMRLNTSHLNYRFLASHLQALHASLTFDYQFKAHPSVIRKLYRLAIPTPAEQQKIAECLSSVDELMAAQARKVDALKTHKKGLMQQLFPREGETQPRLRFPEFQNAGEWEETELGRLISIKGRIGYRGYTVADIVNAGEGAISLSPSNITESGVLGFDKATYITWAKYHESPEIMVEREQTLLVKTGSTFGKVAYVWDLPQECTVNPQIVVLKPHSIHPYFLFLLVFGEVIQTKIRAIVVGGAIPTLSQEAVSKFKIRVPADAEQERIATCLSSLDALITAETQKHEALKTHKQGLMQQLFPSPEAVEA